MLLIATLLSAVDIFDHDSRDLPGSVETFYATAQNAAAAGVEPAGKLSDALVEVCDLADLFDLLLSAEGFCLDNYNIPAGQKGCPEAICFVNVAATGYCKQGFDPLCSQGD
jgi:hypothetical protein